MGFLKKLGKETTKIVRSGRKLTDIIAIKADACSKEAQIDASKDLYKEVTKLIKKYGKEGALRIINLSMKLNKKNGEVLKEIYEELKDK